MENLFYTISEQIAQDIKRRIISGDLKEGSPLREQELSDTYNVSRGPVRDALKALSKEGFVIAKPNVGVKVAPTPSQPVLQLILNTRKDIEKMALDNVFSSIGSEDVETLRNLLADIKNACSQDDIYKVENLDISFHKFFVEKYVDKHLLDLWLNLINRMMFRYSRLSNLMDVYKEHENIVKAIESGDKDKAITLLLDNIQ